MSDQLMRILKQVRKAHDVAQERVNDCMELPKNTYRLIETRHRRPPDLRQNLAEWVEKFEDCVGATPDERKRILDALVAYIFELLQPLLPEGE